MKEIVAERLKELRIEEKLSFQQLSKMTGLSSSSLCAWENCKYDIPSASLVVLAKFYKVSTDYLLGLED